MKRIKYFIFSIVFSICFIGLVNAESYTASDLGIPIISSVSVSGDDVVVKYKGTASSTICNAMKCGIMILERSTERIYRVSNTGTSLTIKNLQKGKTYTFTASYYYVDSYGLYRNSTFSSAKSITVPYDVSQHNVTCAFSTISSRVLTKKKSHNIYFVCYSKDPISSPSKPVTSKVKLSTTKYGSISKIKYVKHSTSGGMHRYQYSLVYTATSKTGYTGGAYITVQRGFVTTTQGVMSPSFSSETVKVDTKGPSVSASKTKGTFKVSKSDPLKIKFSCSDSSEIKSIKINKSTYKYSNVTVKTSIISDKLTYKIVCTDNASNTTTKSYTYKTINAKVEKFISVLNSYSAYAKKDYNAGKPFRYYNSKESKTFKKAQKKASSRRTNCAMLVTWALKDVNVIKYNDKFWCRGGGSIAYRGKAKSNMHNNMTFISGKGKSAGTLIKNGTIKKGDVICWNFGHTNVYAGSSKWFDAGRWGSINGASYATTSGGRFKTFGPVKISSLMKRKVDKIIRIR